MLRPKSVPKRQWAKWGETARRVFRTTYWHLVRNTESAALPLMKLTLAERRLVAHNAAWLAADAANKES